MSLSIISNYHWRDRIYGFELPSKEAEEWKGLEDWEEHLFVFYKGEYLLDEFMSIPEQLQRNCPELAKWQGYMPDSYFSGLLIRYSDDYDQYQIATYIS